MSDFTKAPEDKVTFTITRQMLADFLAAEREMLQLRTNQSRTEFIRMGRAVLTAMEAEAGKALPKGW